MSFTSPNVAALQEEEKRCLNKLTSKAEFLMKDDPRLSFAAALARATEAMPNVYRSYQSVRAQLAQINVAPILPAGLYRG